MNYFTEKYLVRFRDVPNMDDPRRRLRFREVLKGDRILPFLPIPKSNPLDIPHKT